MPSQRLGKFMIFSFSEEHNDDEIRKIMKEARAKPSDGKGLHIFHRAQTWESGPLVAIGGKFRAGATLAYYWPCLEGGKIENLENLYSDEGKWGCKYYFLAEQDLLMP